MESEAGNGQIRGIKDPDWYVYEHMKAQDIVSLKMYQGHCDQCDITWLRHYFEFCPFVGNGAAHRVLYCAAYNHNWLVYFLPALDLPAVYLCSIESTFRLG